MHQTSLQTRRGYAACRLAGKARDARHCPGKQVGFPKIPAAAVPSSLGPLAARAQPPGGTAGAKRKPERLLQAPRGRRSFTLRPLPSRPVRSRPVWPCPVPSRRGGCRGAAVRRGLPRVIPAFAAPLCNPNYKLNSFCARPPLRRDAFPGEPEGGPDGEAALRPLPGARSQPPRPLRWDGGGPAPRDGRRGVLRAAASPLPTAACALPARPRGAVERGPPAPGSGTGRRRRAPSPPRPSAQPRLGRSLTSPGAVPLAGGVRVGFTAPAPSRTNPQLFCGNELYASRAKKKRGGGE